MEVQRFKASWQCYKSKAALHGLDRSELLEIIDKSEKVSTYSLLRFSGASTVIFILLMVCLHSG
ncbi:MAG: hypothetical protein AAF843_10090 [Bacteroidota bacterium]